MQYDPSAGLLRRFMGDMVYLVLLAGTVSLMEIPCGPSRLEGCLVAPVDVTSAPNTATQTQLGVADRSALLQRGACRCARNCSASVLVQMSAPGLRSGALSLPAWNRPSTPSTCFSARRAGGVVLGGKTSPAALFCPLSSG
jgi:hypothetical protein